MADNDIDLTQMLGAVADAVTKKQSATKNYIATQEAEAARVQASAKRVNDVAQDSLIRLDQIAAGGEKARSLASSNNFMDRLELLGAQFTNPGEYTRRGRTARQAEISQELAARNQVHNIVSQDSLANLRVAEAAVAGATAELGMVTEGIQAANNAKQFTLTGMQLDASIESHDERVALDKDLLTSQRKDLDFKERTRQQTEQNATKRLGVEGAELDQALKTQTIRDEINSTQLARQRLAENEQLRQTKLVTMSQADVDAALASGEGAKEIEVGGVKFSQTELRERSKELRMREQISFLAPDITNPAYGAMVQAQQSLMLQTMPLAELRILKANGGEYAPGKVIPMDLIDPMIATKMAEEADQVQTIQDKFLVENQMPTYIESLGPKLDSFRQGANKSPQLSTALAGYEAQIYNLTQATKDGDMSPAQSRALLENVAKAEQAYFNEVSREAKRLAGNDKDLQSIMESQLLGQDIDPGEMREVLSNRLVDSKPIAKVLPSETAKKLNRFYEEEVQILMQEGTANAFGGKMSATEIKEIRKQAATRAVERAGDDMADEQINMLQRRAPTIPGFPSGGLSAEQWNSNIVNDADRLADERIIEQYGMKPSELRDIKAGIEVDGFNRAEIMNARADAAYDAEYMLLEQQEPGLGDKVANWYIDNTTNLPKALVGKMDPATKALVDEKIESGMYMHADNIAGARIRAGRSGAAKTAEFLTHGQDAKYINAILLQSDDKLNEGERKMIMKQVIEPAIRAADAEQLTGRNRLDFIETALQQAKPQDANLKSALSKHRLGRLGLQNNYSVFRDEAILQHYRTANKKYPATKDDVTSFSMTPTGNQSDRLNELKKMDLRRSSISWAYDDSEIEKPAKTLGGVFMDQWMGNR